MVFLLILIVCNFAVLMTMGNTNLMPVCIFANYLLIKHWKSIKKQNLTVLIYILPHLLLGFLLTDLPFSRDHDYYYNLITQYHLNGLETHSTYTSVSIYHHFDLWCMALAMKISSWFTRDLSHYNFYSFIHILLVAILSYRVKAVLFSKNLFGFFLFVFVILISNSFFSKFTWFIDFELNGTKQTLLILLLFEMVVSNKRDLQQLYFLTFIASNPLITSWFSLLAMGAYLFTYIIYKNSKEFKLNFSYFKSGLQFLAFFWSFFLIRLFIENLSLDTSKGNSSYTLLLPKSAKSIILDVITYYTYSPSELYLRLYLIAFTVIHFTLFNNRRRISMAIIIYLLIDVLQAGYLGYKFFEFQQFTSIPLSFIMFFLLSNILHNFFSKKITINVKQLFAS